METTLRSTLIATLHIFLTLYNEILIYIFIRKGDVVWICLIFFSIETLWKNFWSITNEKIIHNIKQEEPSEDLLVGHNKENQGLCSSFT